MSGKAFHSCCRCVLCPWILCSDFSFLPSWPVVLVLWWSWCHNSSIQAANWDFSTPPLLGRDFCAVCSMCRCIKSLTCGWSSIFHLQLSLNLSGFGNQLGVTQIHLLVLWTVMCRRVKKALNIWEHWALLTVQSQLQGREEFSTSAHWDYLQWEIRSKACVGFVYVFMWMIWIFWIWSYLFSSWKRAVKQGNLKLPEHILPPYCRALGW